MKITVYELHSFSKNGAGGNPAGVVFDAADLTEQQMQQTACRAGFSETAFLLPSKIADFRVRFFTPTEEVDLCGHATIALFSLLRQEGKIKDGDYTQETKAGVLKLMVSPERVMMQQPCPVFGETLTKKELASCFNSDVATDDSMPIQIVSTGLRDIILPIKNLEGLYALQLDEARTTALCERYDAVGIHAFCKESAGKGSAAQARNFAPRVGIREESATGTSNGALASFLFRYDGGERSKFVFEQGYSMNLPSEIIAEIKADRDVIREVWVGGTAYQGANSPMQIN
jgi:PhzF family phenazine biosynthesis protein